MPKIYHIVHVDRLESIVSSDCLWSDAKIRDLNLGGTTIGMSSIKQRRLGLPLSSHPGLHVGECVPFYFCPRSVMLYLIYRGNHRELEYRGGQAQIVHLEADLNRTVAWAESTGLRWAFTTSNAGSGYFQDYANLHDLNKIDWDAVQSNWWSDPPVREGKQAEFLIERSFPWHLVDKIGIRTSILYNRIQDVLSRTDHRPTIAIKPGWYY